VPAYASELLHKARDKFDSRFCPREMKPPESTRRIETVTAAASLRKGQLSLLDNQFMVF
jgi:hypothetical protein